MRPLLRKAVWVLLLLSVTLAAVPHDNAGTDRDAAERIAALVKQLAHPEFAQREEATEALAKIGEPALPAVREAAASPDPEVRMRAQGLARAIMLAAGKSPSTGMELVLVRSGDFSMGSPKGEPNRRADEAQHRVRLTRSFLLGAYEVTQEEYRRVMGTDPSWFAKTGPGKDKVFAADTSRFPVEQVSWFDALQFCNCLSERDGYPPHYALTDVKWEGGSIKSAGVALVGGNGYRLPTEAEWEYACRAGTTTAFHFGRLSTGRQANCKSYTSGGGYGDVPQLIHLQRTSKVGSYPRNALGLYDMHGNAGEWCWDWYDQDYYERSPGEDPTGPAAGTQRTLRGGSWLIGDGSCRAASRTGVAPGEGNYYTGFRVARTP